MINIDLSVPRRKEKFTPTQLLVVWICIFLGVAILITAGLVFQWRYLGYLDSDVELLSARRDSLQTLNAELAYQENLRNKYFLILDEANKYKSELDNAMNVMQALRSQLQPGMKLLEFYVKADTVTARISSSSDLKVQRYVEALSRTDLFSEYRSERQGTDDGSVVHKLILRKR